MEFIGKTKRKKVQKLEGFFWRRGEEEVPC